MTLDELIDHLSDMAELQGDLDVASVIVMADEVDVVFFTPHHDRGVAH